MKTVLAVFKDIYTYFKPNSRKKAIRLAIIVLLIGAILKFLIGADVSNENETENRARLVETAFISTFNDSSTFDLIGTVEAVNQAVIQAEASGQVTRVNVSLGEEVSAGQVLAQLENASEYAMVLQAEGAYEAAIASAAQSDIGTSEAEIALQNTKNNIISVYRNSFTTFRSILQTDIDDLFSDPQGTTPGVKIDGGGDTNYLNEQRVEFENTISVWQIATNNVTTDSNLRILAGDALKNLSDLAKMLDTFIFRIQDTDGNTSITTQDLVTITKTFEANRLQINGLLNSIDSSLTALSSAEENLSRAQLGGTNTELSAANARVKQALGSLRAAQANYNKTILSTPIAGVINVLDIKTGDFVSAFTTVATVANNNALEITTFVGVTDKDALEVGQSVLIEHKFDGIISNIAPAVNPLTKKIEVKIQTESSEISNGDTVSISVLQTKIENNVTSELFVPLSAVKFSAQEGSVFSIENGLVTQHPVELGEVKGSVIQILGGVDSTLLIITDARGLNVGQEVESLTK